MIRFPIQDDRDRRVGVPLTHAGAMVAASLAASFRSATPRHGLRRTARIAIVAARLSPVWIGLLATTLIVMIAVLLIQDTAVGLGLLVISPVMAPMVTFGLVTTRGILGFGGELPRRIRSVSLQRSLCPGCRYSLAHLPSEPDGCLACPECGGAWNWDAIGDRGGRDPEIVVVAPVR